jgi:hypothetical protein
MDVVDPDVMDGFPLYRRQRLEQSAYLCLTDCIDRFTGVEGAFSN